MVFPVQADMRESDLTSIADRMCGVGADDIVFGGGILEHQPHGFDILLGVPPVALSVEIAEVQLAVGTDKRLANFVDRRILNFVFDTGDGGRDFAGHKMQRAAR